jgi:hypothetical protein
MSRPYIPLGCDQQSRVTPTRLAGATPLQPYGAALLQRLRTWWAAHIIAADPFDLGPPDDMPRHEGWGESPTDPRRHWPLYLTAFLIGLLAFGLGGCSTGPTLTDAAPPAYGNPAAMAAPRPATSAEPCPTMPLRRVNPDTARSWQDIIDARNAELADAARKECWPQRGPR